LDISLSYKVFFVIASRVFALCGEAIPELIWRLLLEDRKDG